MTDIDWVDASQVRRELGQAIETAGSVTDFARVVGMSLESVRLMVRGKRNITGKALHYLGYEKTTVYRPIDSPVAWPVERDAGSTLPASHLGGRS